MVELAPVDISGSSIMEYINHDFLPVSVGFTPLVKQMRYYTDQGQTDVPQLYADGANAYLVVISDGEDSCEESGREVLDLEIITRQLNNVHGIRTFAIGFATGLVEQLSVIALNGGTGHELFIVESVTDLEEAFAEILPATKSCRLPVGDPDMTNDPELVNIRLVTESSADGELVVYDPSCTDGWHWTSGAHLEVELCGSICDQLKDGRALEVIGTVGCPRVDI